MLIKMAAETSDVEPEHKGNEEPWKQILSMTTSISNRWKTEWIETHLKCHKGAEKVSTDAFGDILFAGYGRKTGKYVRLDVKTAMEDVKYLMSNVWGMETPSLLISVTGGADNFKMSKQLEETFRRGLMKTALTTGAWIITGGTHVGVMKQVGEAVKDLGIASSTQNPVVTIGIVPWGCVKNRDALINKQGVYPAIYRMEQGTNLEASKCFLDPNHSHFILVDNGKDDDFSIEIPFRVELEKEMAKKISTTNRDSDRELVPIVLLVLAGGVGTLKTVHEAIKEKTPAVIVKGSGRVADILAYAYQNANGKNQEGRSHKRTRYMEDALEKKVKEMLEREFGPSNIDKHMNRIKECLVENDFLSVFELDNTSGSREIDLSMLQALLKANKNNVIDQLRLALEWNRIDVAKNDIFTDDKSWTTEKFDELMLLAIQKNRTDFVELFMDNGVSLKEFLTKDRLITLYKKIPKNNCLLKTLLNQMKGKSKGQKKSDDPFADVDMLMQELIGDCFQQFYKIEDNFNLNAPDPVCKNPAQDLFIWSVLMIRQDMAKVFWAEGKDAIAGALVANSLLKAMQDKTKDDELKLKMQSHIDEWSNLAIGVLNECHSTVESKAQNLLVRELDNWGKTTCMLIAVKADNKEFISQPACQFLLDDIWMGKLTKENKTLKLLICTLFPPLALCLLRYKNDRPQSENVEDQTDTLKQKVKDDTLGRKPDGSESTENSKKSSEEEYSVRKKIYYFFKAPVIIFLYNMMSYFVFLALFAYILLFNFNRKVSVEEIALIMWVFTILTEEIRQVAMTSSGTLTKKLQSYITDTWNVLDLITIGLFITGTILRFIPNPDTFEAARLVFALNFVTFFVRLLHLFSVHKELGPKLIMIGRMVQDLMHFVLVLMVFVVSYAIASHSIMFPNSPFEFETINQVMRRSYWNIYGELFLDELEDEDECTFDEAMWINGTYPRCRSVNGKYVVTIMMGVYMLLANVLLLNLLIAMFSYTFQKIQDNTDRHWFFQRYFLTYEYYTRPVLCPPFIVFSHLYLLIRYVVKRCCRSGCKGNQSGKVLFNRMFTYDVQDLIHWENVIADAFHHNIRLKQLQSTEYKVSDTHDRMQILNNKVDAIQEMLNQRCSPELKMPVQLENRLASLEQQIEWIVKAMKANYPVPSSATPAMPNLEVERSKDAAGNLEENT